MHSSPTMTRLSTAARARREKQDKREARWELFGDIMVAACAIALGVAVVSIPFIAGL